MTLSPRRLAASVALAFAGLLFTAAPATAGDDNVAIAVNTKDGFDIFKLAFSVRHVTGDVVDSGNAAVAYASCTDCQTVALAIQVVLISGTDSSVVAPQNLAIAINESCSLCDTLASAYQFVLTTEANVHFTPEGNRRLAELRQALRDLGRGDLTIEQIQAKLDDLMEELLAILRTELVPAGNGAKPSASPTQPDAPPSATATQPDAPPSVTAEPTATVSESVAPTADVTGDPTAEPSATGTP